MVLRLREGLRRRDRPARLSPSSSFPALDSMQGTKKILHQVMEIKVYLALSRHKNVLELRVESIEINRKGKL